LKLQGAIGTEIIVITILSFPRSCLITGFVTRLTLWVPHMEQELLTIPGHLSSLHVLNGVCVARSLVFIKCFVDRCLSFVLVHLVIVLSVLLRVTASGFTF